MPLCIEHKQAGHWSCSMAPNDSNVQAGLRISRIKRTEWAVRGTLLEVEDPQREMLKRLGLHYGTVG